MATILKSSSVTRSSPPIAYHLADVSEQATRCVDEARTQAETILADARLEADRIRRQAEEDGLAAATRRAEEMVDERIDQRIQTLLPALSEAIARLVDARQEWLRHWERSGVELAARIARRIIRRELSDDPEIPLNLVREGLQLAAGAPYLRILLSPADFESLGSRAALLAKEFAAAAKTEIVPDASVSEGGCRVETSHGTIDQQIDTQLERIVRELTDDDS